MTNDEFLAMYGASPTVYSLVYPETTKVIDELMHVMDRQYLHDMFQEPWNHKQDSAHHEFIDAWIRFIKPHVPMIPLQCKYIYPTAGSSEAIREAISQDVRSGKMIYVFAGEYEGYKAFVEAYGGHIIEIDRTLGVEGWEKIPNNEHCALYLSQPSAIDGNVWHEFSTFMAFMADHRPQVKLNIDLCYVGAVNMTPAGSEDNGTDGMYRIPLAYPGIHRVFFSLSKVFGVYYWRIGGVLAKDPLPGLYGNKWFKNLFSLKLGTTLMQRYRCLELPLKYDRIQRQALEIFKTRAGSLDVKGFVKSDVVLMAHRPVGTLSDLDNCYRGVRVNRAGLRVCLTPLMKGLIDGTINAVDQEIIIDASGHIIDNERLYSAVRTQSGT